MVRTKLWDVFKISQQAGFMFFAIFKLWPLSVFYYGRRIEMKMLVVLAVLFLGFVILLVLLYVESVRLGKGTWLLRRVSVLGTYGFGSALAYDLTVWFYSRHTFSGMIGTVLMGIVCLAALLGLVVQTREMVREMAIRSRKDNQNVL
jgi:hypothetical protein